MEILLACVVTLNLYFYETKFLTIWSNIWQTAEKE